MAPQGGVERGMMSGEKYSRQILFEPIATAGQEKLRQSKVVIVGCGALGTAQANALARAGIGRLRIVDRDFVEASNLQRQILFDEADAADNLPKAVAAERKLKLINSDVQVEGVVADLECRNAEELVRSFHVILDGTDNFESRYLLNDVSLKLGIPWIYGAVVASYATTMTVLPGRTPCLACVYPRPPEGAHETCDTVGVIAPAVAWAAAVQVTETLCRACGAKEFVYLTGGGSVQTTLCGRDAVQIRQRESRTLDLATLKDRLERFGTVRGNGFLLQCKLGSFELTLFPDGRAIVKGTQDPAVAR